MLSNVPVSSVDIRVMMNMKPGDVYAYGSVVAFIISAVPDALSDTITTVELLFTHHGLGEVRAYEYRLSRCLTRAYVRVLISQDGFDR